MKTEICVLVAMAALAVSAKTLYVDPLKGDDVNNDGESETAAKETLSAALSIASSGDTVYAMPGRHVKGTQTNGDTRLYRGVVPGGVTLRSLPGHGPADTFIIGEPAKTSPDAYGLGSDAVSCLFLVQDARIRGLTITGGRSTAQGWGGGLNGNVNWGAWAMDCVISNNVAYRGGGASTVDNFYRCKFMYNRATDYGTGVAVNDGRKYLNCVFDANYLWDSNTRGVVYKNSAAAPIVVLNCTFVNGCPECATDKSFDIYNSILMDGSLKGCNYHRCLFTRDWSTDAKSAADDDCRLVTAAELLMDANYRPVKGSAAINAADAEAYDSNFPTVSGVTRETEIALDYACGPRICLGALDIGAGEYDPCADFSVALGCSRVTVTKASAGVVPSAAGTPDLADGETLALVWVHSDDYPCGKLRIRVEGSGALSISRDGGQSVAWAVTSAEDVCDLVVEGDASETLDFSFSGAGVAHIVRCADCGRATVTDAHGGLTITGVASGSGEIGPGGTVTIARNFDASPLCRGFYADGEYFAFSDHEDDWTWSKTVTDPFATLTVTAHYADNTEYFVDPASGKDENDGLTPSSTHAKETLAAALALAKPGDVVWAMPGSHTNGVQAYGGQTYRGVVPDGVTLRSKAGAECTFVVGGDAVSGIRIALGGIVRGFTITGCRTTGNGAALQGDRGWNACVFDCVVSNNVAARGGGASEVDNLYRCRFIDNQATEYGTGAAVNDARNIVNCVFDGKVWDANTRGIVYKNNSATKILNCTFVHGCPDCATAKSLHVYDSILLDGSAKGCSYHNCLFTKDWTTDKNSEADAATRLVSEADLQLDGSFRPRKGSVAIDAGSDSDYESQFPVVNGVDTVAERGLEVCCGQRVYGTSIDVGAGEHDIRPELSRALGNPARISVSEATRDIVLAPSKGVVLSNGTMTVEWVDSQRVPLEEERHFHFSARVEGGGTLLISLDGVPFASLSASDGLKELEFPGTGAKHVLTFSYVAPAADDAGAWLGDFTVPRGMCLILR